MNTTLGIFADIDPAIDACRLATVVPPLPTSSTVIAPGSASGAFDARAPVTVAIAPVTAAGYCLAGGGWNCALTLATKPVAARSYQALPVDSDDVESPANMTRAPSRRTIDAACAGAAIAATSAIAATVRFTMAPCAKAP